MLDLSCFLTAEEISAVLAELKRLCRRSRTRVRHLRNLAIFRLSCCCGLRAKEIAGLNIGDVLTVGPLPVVIVRKDITKGRQGKRRGRKVPLYIDAQTLADLAVWQALRLDAGAGPQDPFVCSLRQGSVGKRLTPKQAGRLWATAIKVLGARRRQLSIHKGRHTFISTCINAGVPLPLVRDWAGHNSIAMTETYIHAAALPGHIKDVFANA